MTDSAQWHNLPVSKKLAIVQMHQGDPHVHPMTCLVNSRHLTPRPEIFGDPTIVVLRCPECNGVQTELPWPSLLAYAKWKEIL